MALEAEQVRKLLTAAVAAFTSNTADEIDQAREAANDGDQAQVINRLAYIQRQAGAAIAWLNANLST
jgi:hypothetical protein